MTKNVSIGTDIEDISRFDGKTLENNRTFLDKIYTERELEYCFKTSQTAQHLCVRFCAKEAVVKALTDFGINDVFYKDVEILNRETGAPYVILAKHPEIGIKISLSHCKTYATATVILLKEEK